MDEHLIREKRELDEKTLAEYRNLEARFIDALTSIRATILVLSSNFTGNRAVRDSLPTPIIDDVREFLRAAGKPTLASEIISFVGESRKQRYPDLLRPFGDIWKSLQFHNKHDKEIVCVEVKAGKIVRAKLQQRAKTRGFPGGKDAADHYREPKNLFWFFSDIGKNVKAAKDDPHPDPPLDRPSSLKSD
jgi:hypothetical protein